MTTNPQPDAGPNGGDARLRFELEVQPETTRCAWHAWVRGIGSTCAQATAEFDSPMALLRFLAQISARQCAPRGTPGLR